MGRETLNHNKYIESGEWKCAESPTGAHHWIEVQNDKHQHTGHWYCKWCHDGKKLSSDWHVFMEINKED